MPATRARHLRHARRFEPPGSSVTSPPAAEATVTTPTSAGGGPAGARLAASPLSPQPAHEDGDAASASGSNQRRSVARASARAS
jgi:hypothetical protein